MSASDQLYDQLEQSITEGSLRANVRLPSERQLAVDHHLSRAAVREVLIRLKAQGYIHSRQGGGHYVATDFRQHTMQPLMDLLVRSPEARFDLLEFRHTIEGDCAYYAALRANDIDRQAITTAFEQMQKTYCDQDLTQTAQADADFHLAIAEASHNLVYLHLMQSLFEVVRNSVFVNVADIFSLESRRDILMRQHSEIYDAIINAQPTTAREAAQRHIRYVEEVLSEMKKEQDRLERSTRRHGPGG